MKLHKEKEDFRVAIIEAGKHSGLEPYIIEKDYWVTKTLNNLFHYQHKEHVVFKGGTALSKGHKIIERFSEDIDLALHPEGIGAGKIHRREGDALHRVVKSIKDSEFTDEEEGKESEGKRYKRVYTFPKAFDYPEVSPIHSKIVLEVNTFSIPTPVIEVEIRSILSDYLEAKEGKAVLVEFDMLPFAVNALSPERIFCEKLLALRRASHRGGEFFSQRIRHVYDIHFLFHSAQIQSLVKNEEEFFQMLNLAYADDEINQKISAEVASDFYSFSIYKDPNIQLKDFQSAYENLKNITFKRTIPSIKETEESLRDIGIKLKDFRF